MNRRREVLILVVAFLALHLPFLEQALVIDDGNFVDQAGQILREPAAPYSFDVRLGGVHDFFHYFANPPGLAYWLACAIGLLGRSEWVVHVACLPLAALAIFATWGLAREVTRSGLFAALLTLAMPAFLVSSHTVMADVPSAGLSTLALWLFFRGVDEERTACLLGAGGAAGAAALIKYSGVMILVPMALYLVLRRRLRPATVASLAIPVAALGAWSAVSIHLYGEAHLFASIALESRSFHWADRATQIAAAVVGLGGATVFPPLLLAWTVAGSFARSRLAGWCAAAAAGAGLLAALPTGDRWPLAYDLPNRLLGGVLLAAGASTCVYVASRAAPLLGVVSRAGREVLEDRSGARCAVLAAYVLVVVAMDASLLFATPKYLVGALAPLAILLAGTSPRDRDPFRSPSGRGVILGTTALVALALAHVSAAQGAAHRSFVRGAVREIAAGRTVWFTGHWTVRHYSERAGYRWLGPRLTPGAIPGSGDVVFFVLDAPWHAPEELMPRLVPLERRVATDVLPLHLANQTVRAGYWSHGYGMLPYVWSRAPMSVLETFVVAGRPPPVRAPIRSSAD